MYNNFEEAMKELHKMAADNATWEAGCRELFGNAEMSVQDAIKAIRHKGAELIVHEATWYKADTTGGFEQWLTEKVRADKLPKHLSMDAFLDEFHDVLMDQFNKEKKDAEAGA